MSRPLESQEKSSRWVVVGGWWVETKNRVLLRSRSGRSEIDLSLTLFLVFTTTHHPPHKLFSWLLRGLDKSDGPRMGWYDSSSVRGGQDLNVDFNGLNLQVYLMCPVQRSSYTFIFYCSNFYLRYTQDIELGKNKKIFFSRINFCFQIK